MRCKKCMKELENRWKFCPYCGDKKSLFNLFRRKPKRQLTPEEEMQRMIKPVEGMLKMMGFPVKMNIKFGGPESNPRMGVGTVNQVQVPVQEQARKVKEVLEPITKTTKTGNGTKYVFLIPGVMTPNDIRIRQFEESIEIKAYAKDKAYFKVVPINPNSQVIEKKYQEEMLKLVVS